MISSYEVGALFRIVDEASPALERIAKLGRDVDVTMTAAVKTLRSFGRLTFSGVTTGATKAADAIARIGKVSEDTSGAFAASLGAMNADLVMATANARELSAALARAAGVARGLRVPNVAGVGAGAVGGVGIGGRGGRHGPGRGGSRGGGFVTEGIGMPLPGGMRGYFRAGSSHHGTAAMIGAGALAYGVFEQAELEDAIFQMKWHAGLPNTPENDKYFRSLIQSTAATTGFGYKEIAEAATDEIRLLKGAAGKESGGLGILPEMLRAAAVEAKVKPGTNLKGAMDSLVQQAHMAQEYGIEDIKGMAPLLAFLSTTNPATMPQMVRAASYAMPTLHTALNVKPEDVLYEATALARAGATNTKSGTWLRAAFERLLPPDPRIMSSKEYARRMFAMKEVGLVDEAGKYLAYDPTGEFVDINLAKSLVRQKTELLPIAERSAMMKKNFGEQGQRGMSILMSPAVVAQEAELKREFPEFKGRYATFFEDYSKESPIQKARETWQDMTNVLADLGQYVLPPLLVGLRGVDEIFKTISGHLPSQGTTFGPPAKGTLGEALGKGMAEGVLMTSPLSIGAAMTGYGLPVAATIAALSAFAGGTYEGGKFLLGGALTAAPAWPNAPPAIGTGGPVGAVGAGTASSQHTTIDATIKADPSMDQEGLAKRVAHYLAELLGMSSQHNLGQADGALSSQFTSGGDIP